MPITVKLQGMHSYSPIIIIVAVVLFIVMAAVAIAIIIIKMKKRTTIRPVREISVEERINIKQKYLVWLNGLEQRCRGGRISNRKAYQELSKIIRHFVYEATGIKVHNYTLEEIRCTNISGLYAVVNECYVPEFAADKNGDIYGSVARARKVIEEWN